jgi:tetratricopeptide (TPR) repeat protein
MASLDSQASLRRWYESTIDALLADENTADALAFQVSLNRNVAIKGTFNSREKYVSRAALNVDTTVDCLLACSRSGDVVSQISTILSAVRALPLNRTEGTAKHTDKANPNRHEQRAELEHLLRHLGLWPSAYLVYLRRAQPRRLCRLLDPEGQVPIVSEEEIRDCAHYSLRLLHLSSRTAVRYAQAAWACLGKSDTKNALIHFRTALMGDPDWGAVHLVVAKHMALSGDIESAAVFGLKAALCRTPNCTIELIETALQSQQPLQAVSAALASIKIEEKAAISEHLVGTVSDLAWLHFSLDKDEIIQSTHDPSEIKEFALPEDPALRALQLTPIEWEECNGLMPSPLDQEGTVPPQDGLDPRVKSFSDLSNWFAVSIGHGNEDSNREVPTPAAFSLVGPQKTAAQSHLKAGQFQDVVKILAPMEKFHLLLPADYLALGQAMMAMSRLADAAKALEKGKALLPHDVRFDRALASLDLQNGNVPAALIRCKQALLLKPDYCNLHLQLAASYEKLGERREAVRYYQTASLCSDVLPTRHYTIIDHLKSLGHPLEACGAALRLLICQRTPEVQSLLALCVFDLGQLQNQTAVDVLVAQREAAWNDAGALLVVGAALDDIEAFPEAIQCYKRVIELRGSSMEVFFNMGNTYLLWEGHNEESVKAYESALYAAPDNAEVLGGLGDAHRRGGRDKQAISYYRKALAIDPHLENVWTNLGNLYASSGELKEALNCQEKAVECNPDNSLYRANLMAAQLGCRQYDVALRNCVDALDRWPREKIFRQAVTHCLLEGGISLNEASGIQPDLHFAMSFSTTMGWITPSMYSKGLLAGLCLLGRQATEELGQLGYALPVIGFNLAFCYRRLTQPLFDPDFLRLDVWTEEALVAKALCINEIKLDIATVALIEEFLTQHSTSSETDMARLLAGAASTRYIQWGYRFFLACFPV